jgi:hypothetical protein
MLCQLPQDQTGTQPGQPGVQDKTQPAQHPGQAADGPQPIKSGQGHQAKSGGQRQGHEQERCTAAGDFRCHDCNSFVK